ncbi:MAG: GNAT family N-acetyltransferase, partial [Flavobacteriales bacterium]|nr:GNAT family N-acetyltransferase [Flavobacteriales bacterium]
MEVFRTERLVIKTLEKKDEIFFTELLSDPQIIDSIPHPPFAIEQISNKFNSYLNSDNDILSNKRSVWGIFVKGNPDMIGLCLFITNNDGDRELGYRFRVDYWGKGYGTETTKGIIDFALITLKLDKITADVDVTNIASIKILEKFLHPVKEFYNEE